MDHRLPPGCFFGLRHSESRIMLPPPDLGQSATNEMMMIERIKILTSILCGTLLVGCTPHRSSPLPRSAVGLAGNYYRGDGTGYNIYLDLLSCGRYDAQWHGCLGVYGTARGTWTMVNDRVVLSPVKETDMMKGHLRELHVVKLESQTVLVPDLHDDYYQKYGPDAYAAFYRQDKK